MFENDRLLAANALRCSLFMVTWEKKNWLYLIVFY